MLVAALLVSACGGEDSNTPADGGARDSGTVVDSGVPDAGSEDAGTDDAGVTDAGAGDGDAGVTDAGANDDAGVPDAGPGGDDAGVPDAGSDDAGVADAGSSDAGTPDAGSDDAGVPDAGASDAGTPDAGAPDAGASDAGTPDAGSADAGSADAGSPDAGANDAGTPDGGSGDAGTPDAGSGDAGVPDAGSGDAGTPDAGSGDAGVPDAGSGDAGTPDAGSGDAGVPDAGSGDAGTPDAGSDGGTIATVEMLIKSAVENEGAAITVYGWVTMVGVSSQQGPVPGLVAEAGYGPLGSDARSANWVWRTASYIGSEDQYAAYTGWLTPLAGNWDIAMRFTLGDTVVYADVNPATPYTPREHERVQLMAPGTEIPYCGVWHPYEVTIPVGASDLIYAQVYVPGLTDESESPQYAIESMVGFGPEGSDPRSSSGWIWFNSGVNDEFCCFWSNNDEHYGPLWPTEPGTYRYAYRFRLWDGETGWTYCDTDGSGTHTELDFDPSKLGTLTVPAP
ncbi:hypothetical protein HPC49_35115 [Pyxidicoccus fallax]|uniref:Lipoprotein n=1 Tax=Pyxidicoccus fallax TaxID=394095 RepID=A0A848LWF6_9BACT|nr:hypothetical protein [Pyxidicoccus fallax]NMO21971.1 hypothetical protein [Pyxidicoccus fallax]NPC83442.1 hypothetical protein [Pyxidicoccus fallax]